MVTEATSPFAPAGGPLIRPFDLLAVGDPVADIVIQAGRLPGWDEKVHARAAQVFAGGTEANAAFAASRLGLRTAIAGCVGGDAQGAWLRQEFAAAEVDTRWLRVAPATASAMTVVFVSDEGERALVFVPMPHGPDSSDAVVDLAVPLRQARAVYTMPYDLPRFEALAAAARAAGTEVVVDIERQVVREPRLLQTLLDGADLVFMNEAGFFAATGRAATLASARALIGRGRARCIVVSLGARGALAVDTWSDASQPAWPTAVRDTTGAGDTFNAAFLAARQGGQSLQECLGFACAAASFTVAAVGARTGMPRAAEVRARLAGGR